MSEKRGRPRKIESPEALDAGVDDYIALCTLNEKPITLTGCLVHMGIYSRSTLDEYEKRDGFSEPVKRLRALVAEAYETRLHGNSPTGAIFALKNMGWSDRQEISGPDGGPIQTEDVSARDIIAGRIAGIAARGGTGGNTGGTDGGAG